MVSSSRELVTFELNQKFITQISKVEPSKISLGKLYMILQKKKLYFKESLASNHVAQKWITLYGIIIMSERARYVESCYLEPYCERE